MTEQFGPYILQALIGRGGMGEVYRAFDTQKGRTVALKRLPRELASDETFQSRFRRESRMAARLNEPHVIPIHDFGEIEGHLYIDMRLVEGVDLATLIETEGGRLTASTSVDLIGQVAAALDAAHNGGLVHRDVKPSNVLVTGSTAELGSAFAYLVDFGIARALPGHGGTALTTTTGTIGTLGYMAPERISGDPGDNRADVYSLACLLYECLTGHAPFLGESFQVMYAHMNTEPPSASAGGRQVPKALDEVVRRGMAKDPVRRFQTAGQLASSARLALTKSPTQVVVPAAPTHVEPVRPLYHPTVVPQASYNPRLYNPTVAPGAPPPPPSPPSRSDRRLLVLAAVLALLALAVGTGIILVVRSDQKTQAGPVSTGPTTTGPPTTAVVSGTWSNYSEFTSLVGRSPGDTTTAFMNATCALKPPDQVDGMIDQVECTLPSSPVLVYVARFSAASAVQAFVDATVTYQDYTKSFWTLAAKNRGVQYRSPTTVTFTDITSTICDRPTYLVQFYAPAGSGISQDTLRTTYWEKSKFPDYTPAVC